MSHCKTKLFVVHTVPPLQKVEVTYFTFCNMKLGWAWRWQHTQQTTQLATQHHNNVQEIVGLLLGLENSLFHRQLKCKFSVKLKKGNWDRAEM